MGYRLGRVGPSRVSCRRATGEIEATALFEDVQVRHHDWEVRYDTESYIELLRTFSGHVAMTREAQAHLFEAIRAGLAARADHGVRRHWGAVLHLARTRAAAPHGPGRHSR